MKVIAIFVTFFAFLRWVTVHDSVKRLSKRIITPESQGMSVDDFMYTYAKRNMAAKITNVADLGRDSKGRTPGSQSAYAKLMNEKEPFGFSVALLRGCTAVVVVSNTAVWVAHIYEVLDDVKNFRNEWKPIGDNVPNATGIVNPSFTKEELQIFTDYITDFLKGPGASEGYQVDLTSKRKEFAKPSSRIYIMTPEMGYPNIRPHQPMEYPKQIPVLQKALSDATGIHLRNVYVTLYDAWASAIIRHRIMGPQNFANGRALYLFVGNVLNED